jgi:hypothetical protein
MNNQHGEKAKQKLKESVCDENSIHLYIYTSIHIHTYRTLRQHGEKAKQKLKESVCDEDSIHTDLGQRCSSR